MSVHVALQFSVAWTVIPLCLAHAAKEAERRQSNDGNGQRVRVPM